MLQNCCRILFFYCRSAPFLQLNAPRKFRLLCKDSPSITGMAHSPYQSYLHDILSVIFDNRTSTKLKSTYNLLDYTIEYMQQAFSTNITLAKLADLAGMNPSYYSQLFKRKMKKGPTEYLTDLRMNQAKQQLLQPSGKIRDIARDVGHKDDFYFSRRFKACSRIAPTAYMKKRHIHIVSLSQPYTDHLFTLGVCSWLQNKNYTNRYLKIWHGLMDKVQS